MEPPYWFSWGGRYEPTWDPFHPLQFWWVVSKPSPDFPWPMEIWHFQQGRAGCPTAALSLPWPPSSPHFPLSNQQRETDAQLENGCQSLQLIFTSEFLGPLSLALEEGRERHRSPHQADNSTSVIVSFFFNRLRIVRKSDVIVETTETVKPSLNTHPFVPISGPNHKFQDHRKSSNQYGTSKISLSGVLLFREAEKQSHCWRRMWDPGGIFLAGKCYRMLVCWQEWPSREGTEMIQRKGMVAGRRPWAGRKGGTTTQVVPVVGQGETFIVTIRKHSTRGHQHSYVWRFSGRFCFYLFYFCFHFIYFVSVFIYSAKKGAKPTAKSEKQRGDIDSLMREEKV